MLNLCSISRSAFRRFAAIPCLAAAAFADAGVNPADLLAKADGYRNFRGKSFTFDVELSNFEPGGETKNFKLHGESLDSHRLLLVYLAPAKEKNNAILMNGNSLWFHTPNTRRPMRITPQQRLVGEASNGDVASTDFSGDYDPIFLKSDTAQGDSCHVLELKAKPGSMAAYKILNLFLRIKDAAPRKAEFMAPSGKLLKTAYFTRFEAVPGARDKMQLVEMEILNPLKPGKKTVMKYSNFAVQSLPESHFQPEWLDNLH
jgi:outer membrane lipoprotein-sorting protein